MRNAFIFRPDFFAIAIFSIPARAAVPNYQLVKDQSTLQFTATQNGSPVKGRFTNFTTDIQFDAAQLNQSHINVTVDMASAAVADEDIAKYIKLPDWLSATAFPQAVFRSTQITAVAKSNHYQAAGLLTLRGKTVPAILDFELTPIDAQTTTAKGNVILNRNDFGIGAGEWAKDDMIKNAVKVDFTITAVKASG